MAKENIADIYVLISNQIENCIKKTAKVCFIFKINNNYVYYFIFIFDYSGS